jgi:predicted Zn-dependent peptidase
VGRHLEAAPGQREDGAAPWHVHRAALDIHVRVGSRYESARDNGISHFHEHMLHRGIPGHETAHAQALAFEQLGAAFGAMTYVDHGVLSCSVPAENLEKSLELTALLCEKPLFNDIALEKGIVREELLEAYDGAGRLVDGASILRKLCFGRHPLGMPIAGTRATRTSTYPQLRTISRSFASTCNPGFASTSATVPSTSARTLVSIFMASIVSSSSPF